MLLASWTKNRTIHYRCKDLPLRYVSSRSIFVSANADRWDLGNSKSSCDNKKKRKRSGNGSFVREQWRGISRGGEGWVSSARARTLSTSTTTTTTTTAAEKNAHVSCARIDIDKLVENIDVFKENMKLRQIDALGDPEKVCELGIAWKKITNELNSQRKERNKLAKLGKKSKPNPETIAKAKELKVEISKLEHDLATLENELEIEAATLPNWLHPKVPKPGAENQDEHGEGVIIGNSIKVPFPTFDFEPKSHIELGEALDIVDFVRPVKTSGPKFASFKNQGVFLELALTQWVLRKIQSKGGFAPTMTPDLVHARMLEGCGFQPRGESSHVYRVSNDGESHKHVDLCLVGTSEIPLAASLAGHQFRDPCNELPMRLAGHGHCFRAEAGAAGAASKGLYRLHQFSKVEMFVFCLPEQADDELERMVDLQQEICDDLGLHWRMIDMLPHELGHPASRKFDIQVYMPSRSSFGEVASLSNCGDFQARRLNIRYTNNNNSNHPSENSSDPSLVSDRGFVSTLNGTAIAIPRIILSILETCQQPDGSVRLPPCLEPYIGSENMTLS